jgi:hypothetical protein
MKKTISRTVKGAVLAGIAVAAVSSAQAQYASLGGAYASGDAVAGFTTGSGNDLIVNLGAISSLANGEQWNLSTLLGTGSGDAGFSSLNSLDWGVLGIVGSGRNFTSYSTVLPVGPSGVNASDSGELNTLFGGINNSEVISASGSTSWYNNVQTANSGNSSAPYSYLLGSADSITPASGTFDQDAKWYAGTGAQPEGFSLSSSGILTYGTAVPEPGTYGFFAGVGMLLLAVRRQFARA